MNRVIIFTLAIILASIGSIFAQRPTSNVSGTIRDLSGAAVAGASVRLANSQQIGIVVTLSDTAGSYKFENVSVGTYVLTVEQKGFSASRRSLNIVDTPATDVDFVLSINQITEQVTVTADTGRAEEVQRIPVQINTISQDSILQRSTGVISQIADEETGISLQRTSPTIGAVLVRGLTEVGVYVDGIRYTNSTQRGGINTFFNLNESTGLQSIEVQRSPNTAQFGSDGLGGNVQLLTRQPSFGLDNPVWNGEMNTLFNGADNSFGGNTLIGFGTKKYGILGNVFSRRINPLRTGGGIDSHSAITRFFGLPSNITGKDSLPDTAFTQYGGSVKVNASLSDQQTLSFSYQRSQQDGGKRYDQLLGGDGNLIADLRNLMLDLGYIRYVKVGVSFFDTLSANVSYNSQREERVNQGGQGNWLGAITNDKERTTSWGFGFYIDKQFGRNGFLFGGDLYHDKVKAPSFNTDPATNVVTSVRPRVPDGSTYDLGGLYIQNVFEAVPDRLRLSGALRYNVGVYNSRTANSPIVAGNRLFPNDSARFTDLSGRIGATVTIAKGLNASFNFSRGFRAPNITSLGGLGLVGVGFQVSTSDVIGLGATIGTTADATATSSGTAVSPLRSEISNNFDLSIRYRNKRFEANATGFLIDYGDTIVRQTLILPQGAVGTTLGSQTITTQNANGAVFVPASTSPVLVQSNFGDTRLKGLEFNYEYRFSDDWTVAGNYSYVYAADKVTGLAPNLGGGGLPPQFGFFRLRYQPAGKRFWVEGYSSAAGRQSRLSTLDISDRRTGGARTRTQIQNFFRRGACVRGITTVGTNGLCGSAGGTLVATGETLAQVQNRMLPLGAMINGVLIVNNDTSVPLFNAIPGYVLFNARGGYRFGENHVVTVDLENIADKSHRSPGWGIDGPGRSVTLRYQFKF